MPPMLPATALCFLALAAPAAAQRARQHPPRFLIVDASGAPDADHTSLQKAIEAAADGSEILVRDGMYTPVEIVAKSLRIVADESRLSFLSSLTVRDLAAGQAVTVRGLRFHPGPEVLDTAIAVRDCAGSVWLEELEVTDEVASLSPTTSLEVSSSLVEVEDSASVVLSRCLLAGVAPVAKPVLALTRSTTFLFDTTMGAQDHQTVIRVEDGRLEIHGGSFDTICGMYGAPPCTLGPSLRLVGTDPVAVLQDVRMAYAPPLIEAGTLHTIARRARTHRAASPAYDDGTVAVELAGRPGDLVWVSVAARPARARFLPGFDAPLLLPDARQTLFVGTLTSSTLAYQRSIGDLAPGTAVTLHFQALFVNAAAGETVQSEPTAVTFLDAGSRPPEHFLPDVPAVEISPAGNVAFGACVQSAGDVNGDGYDDVIVGDPGYELLPGSQTYPYSFRGLAQVYHGSSAGLSAAPAWSRAGDTSTDDYSPRAFGNTVGRAGDVNGDGFDDVFVTLESPYDELWIFYGSASGVSSAGATHIVEAPEADPRGHCAAGDVNGDGFDDLWMCTPSGFNESGVLRHGSAGGLLSTGWTYTSPTDYARVARAGDVNGDGFDDLLFGMLEMDVVGASTGTIALFLGGPSAPTLAWTYADPDVGLVVNDFVGAGDFDQDGFDDLVFGADLDRLLVFHGASPAPASVPDRVLTTPFFSSFGNLMGGSRVLPLGDVDGDGSPEILVSGLSCPPAEAETWFVLRGSAAGPRLSPSWAHPLAWFGAVSSPAGDLDGDGRLDLVFGAYDTDLRDGADGGSITVFPGLP